MLVMMCCIKEDGIKVLVYIRETSKYTLCSQLLCNPKTT